VISAKCCAPHIRGIDHTKGGTTARIAVISDIHSNLQALESALAVIDKAKVDEVLCLGDIVGYGANPNECIEVVRKRCTVVVKGNHDLAAVDLSHAGYFTSPGKAAALWTNKVLSTDNRDYLASLPMVKVEGECTLVHASPNAPQEWTYVLSMGIAAEQFKHFQTKFCLIGHTHVPAICGEDLKTFTFKKGQRFLINPGSVGQPRDGNPQLSFGLLDTEAWTYENKRGNYDIAGAEAAILEAGLPGVLAARLGHGL
jgi:predicted phosphodiesterase